MFKANIRRENGMPQLYINDERTAPMLLWLNTNSRQDDDLNTAQAITALYDVFKLKTNDATKLALIRDFDYVLSLDLIRLAGEIAKEEPVDQNASLDPEFRAYIEEAIARRREAKKAKNFALADEIRAELLSRGVTLLDTREGTTYTVE